MHVALVPIQLHRSMITPDRSYSDISNKTIVLRLPRVSIRITCNWLEESKKIHVYQYCGFSQCGKNRIKTTFTIKPSRDLKEKMKVLLFCSANAFLIQSNRYSNGSQVGGNWGGRTQTGYTWPAGIWFNKYWLVQIQYSRYNERSIKAM